MLFWIGTTLVGMHLDEFRFGTPRDSGAILCRQETPTNVLASRFNTDHLFPASNYSLLIARYCSIRGLNNCDPSRGEAGVPIRDL
jgi:hypothetical protein